MSQQELLKRVIQALNDAGIEYMLTGSVVSSMQGEPWSTHDVDIVISIHRSKVPALIAGFPWPDFYLDEEAVYDAIKRQIMFNLISTQTGDNVDFWILTEEPFDKSRFPRRIGEEFMGIKMHVSSPEDTILAKLRWSKLSGGSEKQFTDALRVYEVQHGILDREYIERWAEMLDVKELWKRLADEAEVI